MRTSLLIASAEGELIEFAQPLADTYGYRVETAKGGVECLNLLRTFRPDVLIVEQNLPWGGAAGVIDRVRNEADLPKVPAVVICEAEAPDVAALEGTPVSFVLKRPLALTSLVDYIEAAVSFALSRKSA